MSKTSSSHAMRNRQWVADSCVTQCLQNDSIDTGLSRSWRGTARR